MGARERPRRKSGRVPVTRRAPRSSGVPVVPIVVALVVAGAGGLYLITRSSSSGATGSRGGAITEDLVEATARDILAQELRAQGGLPADARPTC